MRVVNTRIFSSDSFQTEIDLRAFGSPDPVALHGEHASGQCPSSLSHVAQQFVGIIGDPQEPLLQLALLHRRVLMPPAAAVHYLLVGQHRTALRTPVHQRLLAIGQPALQHFQKEPLVPAIIFGLAGGHFARQS